MGAQRRGNLLVDFELWFCPDCCGLGDGADDPRLLPELPLDDWHWTGGLGYAPLAALTPSG